MGNPSSFVEAASVKDVDTFDQAQTFSSGITVTGGITGGVRQLLPFGQPNVALGDNATPASSTPVQTYACGASALSTCGFVAMRAGSLTGLSVNLSGAASGSYAIAAGDVIDVIDVRTGSGWSATTVDAFIAVEIEC